MEERKENRLDKVAELVKLVKALEFEGNTKKNKAMDTPEAEGKIHTFSKSKKLVDSWSKDIDVQHFMSVKEGCLMSDEM